ncbi:chemotaxis protein CheW [Azospirillum thermophilum]|uniref:Chemotaxis protein CheW n=1 Tax=Azospirillum thermophilum TaxID=2202148 RepID=A0A2S2CY79_9PROT|nr:chemotaxis protein CheW [Azospirillum thermophilum]AWK89237.1 chemotaxis protein CheW [Azospirillum thermophilum]
MADQAEETDGELRLVTFTAGGFGFALPLPDVLEVVRPPALVRIPLGPPALEGLAQRQGLAIPVLDLARAMGLEAEAATAGRGTAARVVIVRHGGQAVGLLVDRMAGLVAVPADTVDPVDPGVESGLDPELLSGMLRAPPLMLLDAGTVIDRQFRDLARSDGGDAVPVVAAGPAAGAAVRAAVDEVGLLVFQVGGQEFALPVDRVAEVVPAPAGVTRLPRAGAHLLGVMTLRDGLLPLVALRALFALDDGRDGDGADGGKVNGGGRRVVVARTRDAATGREEPVGLLVDDVRELLRIERARIDPVPPLLAREAEFEDLDGIVRADGGRRLVSLLSAERLFRHGVALAGGQEETAMSQPAPAGATERSESVLVFRLAGAEYGLPVAAVQEVLRRPDAPTPLPNAPEFVAGVVTLRGAVVPLIDQRRLLHLPQAVGQGDRGRVVVVASGEARAGLLVDGLAGLQRIPDRAIGPAPAVSQAQHRLIRRVATLEEAGGGRRMILLMDPAELLDMERLAALLPAK